MEENFLLKTDSYKITHHLQYPEGTERIFSYFESRGGKFKEVLFFGLQYILKKHLVGVVVTNEMIDEAKQFFGEHFNDPEHKFFNEAGWRHIVEKHGGKLPLEIRAVPEGLTVPTSNVLFTVENTDPKVPWLTNYVETLLVQAWYPITVATNSFMMKQMLAQSLTRTADSQDKLPFMLHDFGFRGSTSVESAGIGGAAHLVNFRGTDTLAGIITARRFYGAGMAGVSIPATEHSTMTTWGRDGEREAVRHVLEQVGEQAAVSVVADSYDVWNMLENVLGGELKKLVEGRSGVLVVRPDSGEPREVVVKVLNILGKEFGHSTNSRGFKLLPPYIRVIQGDGISHDSLQGILTAIEASGWSLDNLVFGSGGGLLQRLDRDTQRCAYKCSMTVRNGQELDVYKDPVTDPGKTSKKGRLTLVKDSQGLMSTVRQKDVNGREDLMVTVFRNGDLVREWTWEEVCGRQNSS